MKLNFSEKQGRLTLQIDCYLEMDLSNEELVNLYNELDIEIKHPLIADIDTAVINENDKPIRS